MHRLWHDVDLAHALLPILLRQTVVRNISSLTLDVVSQAPALDPFCEHFVAPTVSAGCVFFSMKSFVQQILINVLFISFEISSHFSCLLPAVSLSILFTPMLICFTVKRFLIIERCLELLRLGLRLLLHRLLRLRNCRVDPCGESCYDTVHVLCVDFLLQELSHLHWLSALRCHVGADALDLGCLVLDVRGNCLLLMAIPSACPCWTTASVLGCFGTGCSFPL